MDQLTKKITSNTFLTGTIVVGVGSMLASFFSYLLQFFVGRTLSVEDFGSFNALLSLSYLVGVPAGVFGVSLIKSVSELSSKGEQKQLTALFWKLAGIAMFLGGLVFLIIFSFRYVISDQLKIYNPIAVSLFGVSMGMSFVGAIPSSYFQGLLRYKGYAAYSVASSFFRLIVPVGLIFLGYKLIGVFAGINIALIFSFTFAVTLLKKNLTVFENLDLRENYKRILYFSLPVLFVNFGLMLLNNIDVIMVKRYFDPTSAGYYAGTVTLGKIFLFGAGAVSTVMFPMISGLHARGEDTSKRLAQFFVLQIAIVGAGILCYELFPKLLTTLFFGSRFLASVEYLPRFAWFIGFYVLINFLVLYFLAVNKTMVFLFLIPGLIVQFFMISAHHETLYQVIDANIAASLISLILLMLYHLNQYARRNRQVI